MALAPHEAISCLADLMRTVKFICSIHAAILDLKRFPDETLNVVYAGCGPLAPLVTTLCPLLDSQQIDFTLLDIHEPSLESVNQVIDGLGIRDFFADVLCTDATTYQFSDGKPLHLVITETMQAGLQHEPQVAIMHNFSQQLCDGGLLVPQQVSIGLTLGDPAEIFQPNQSSSGVDLGKVFDVDRKFLQSLQLGTNRLERLPAASIEMPSEIPQSHHLMLSTKVHIFEDIILEAQESGITSHLILRLEDPIAEIKALNFVYCCTGTPGFSIEVITR